ncbi:RmlC-like cupins superfamily protein [Perilla frutescens var. frutescens]|nr:RmlC-like cupins superfamily protein [Perilla frutescens var. frutescens]
MKSTEIHLLLFIAILAIFFLVANASDPDPLQDFCVSANSTTTATVFVNGKTCKDPNTVTVDDFFYSGLNKPGNITSPLGSKVTMVFERQLAGLNTFGVATARLDFAPNGLNPPHEHPRASEVLVVLEGTLYAGFITSNPPDPNDNSRLFAKILYPGDVFVFPRGLIHFQYNVGDTNAVALVSFNSQNPGVVTVAKVEFGSEPPVLAAVLAKAFQIDESLVKFLQSLPWTGNN